MAATQQNPGTIRAAREAAPPRLYSAAVQFVDEQANRMSSPTSVDIYAVGNSWYCRVRSGDMLTRPLGPYTRREAQRIQDVRRRLIARTGTARLIFE